MVSFVSQVSSLSQKSNLRVLRSAAKREDTGFRGAPLRPKYGRSADNNLVGLVISTEKVTNVKVTNSHMIGPISTKLFVGTF